MEQRQLSFAIYEYHVTFLQNTEGLLLSSANGIDMFEGFQKVLTTVTGKERWTTEDCKLVSYVSADPKRRLVWGTLEIGTRGEKRSIRKPGQAAVKTIESDESATDSFFYCFYVPLKGKTSFFMLQQRQTVTNVTYFHQQINVQLEKNNLELRIRRAAPPDYDKKIKESNLKQITLTRKALPKSLEALAGLGNVEEIGKVIITVEAKRDRGLNSWVKSFGKKSAYQTSEILDVKDGPAKLRFDYNGKSISVGADLEALGRPSFQPIIDWGNDGPEVESMLLFATEAFAELFQWLPDEKK
jgi:hypothetical protein